MSPPHPSRFFARPALLLLVGFLAWANTGPSQAGPFDKDPQKLDLRLKKMTERFVSLQTGPKGRVPQQLLSRARGIIILYKVKAGLLVGGEAGNGVALVRDRETGHWSAPAFVVSAEGSYGLQIGAQESVIVLLLMNDEGLKILQGGTPDIGVDIAATAGPIANRGGDIDTTTLKTPILVYSNADGLFAGAAFKGGGIGEAKKNNLVYYGKSLNEVLFRQSVRPTKSGVELIDTINRYTGDQRRFGY